MIPGSGILWTTLPGPDLLLSPVTFSERLSIGLSANSSAVQSVPQPNKLARVHRRHPDDMVFPDPLAG